MDASYGTGLGAIKTFLYKKKYLNTWLVPFNTTALAAGVSVLRKSFILVSFVVMPPFTRAYPTISLHASVGTCVANSGRGFLEC